MRRRRRAIAGHGQAIAGRAERGEQQGGHACSEARP
jgi:hypothetical protein